MNFSHNLCLNSDSYKFSMYNQYPEGTEYVYSYIESRGGQYDQLVFFGLQAFLREYMTTRVTAKMVRQARDFMKLHGEPFNYDGWMYIVKQHKGKLPVEIKSVDEGTVMCLRNVLVSIVNTDPKCFWLTSFLETALLRAIWYPTTVASNSYQSKQIILEALAETGDPGTIDFKLHDFGARGVSSLESAGLGGMAHLINFMGTDTVTGILAAMEYYDAEVCGFSIPAMEHSTVTSWGRENEAKAYSNMLKIYGKPGQPIAFVSDSYDIFNASDKIWGVELKQQVIDSGAVVVIRPDSGEPSDVVVKCLYLLEKHYGSTTNTKGYRVLNNVRIIQGDGIDATTISSILFCMKLARFSADNVAFGQGGALLQIVNRDTLQFAMKCSAAKINGVWVEVYKDPVTSSMKKSKKGRLMLVTDESGKFVTKVLEEGKDIVDHLTTRFVDGELYNQTTFEQVRARAKEGVR